MKRGTTHLSSRRWTIFLLILMPLLVSLACVSLTGGGSPADVVFGPGAFIFPDTKAGLADLSSYKAILTLSFEGSKDGQIQQWSKTYLMLNTKEPAARQLTLEKTGDLAEFNPIFMAEVNGAAYESRGGNTCNANVIDQENLLAETWEPAGFLPGVIGAEEAGAETINDIAANHYTFDERAFGQLGLAQSTGEMWIASDGGYVVKYMLTTKGDTDYFGEGIEGTLTWDYELTDVNQPVTIELPADCPAGMVDAPLLPDASDVLNMPGILTYDTSTSPADIAAFYQTELPNMGWELVGEPTVDDTTALLDFTQGDNTMAIIITSGDAGAKVYIALGGSSGQTVTDSAPADPQAAAGTLDAPLLPDASNVVNTAGVLSYETASSPADATAFYREQLPTLGWQPLGEPALTDAMTLLTYTQGDQTMTVIIMAGAGVTTVTIGLE